MCILFIWHLSRFRCLCPNSVHGHLCVHRKYIIKVRWRRRGACRSIEELRVVRDKSICFFGFSFVRHNTGRRSCFATHVCVRQIVWKSKVFKLKATACPLAILFCDKYAHTQLCIVFYTTSSTFTVVSCGERINAQAWFFTRATTSHHVDACVIFVKRHTHLYTRIHIDRHTRKRSWCARRLHLHGDRPGDVYLFDAVYTGRTADAHNGARGTAFPTIFQRVTRDKSAIFSMISVTLDVSPKRLFM